MSGRDKLVVAVRWPSGDWFNHCTCMTNLGEEVREHCLTRVCIPSVNVHLYFIRNYDFSLTLYEWFSCLTLSIP